MKATSLQVIVLKSVFPCLPPSFCPVSLTTPLPPSHPRSFPHTPAPSLTPPSLPLSLGGTTFNSSGIRILCLTLTKWWTLFHYFSHFYGEHNRSHKHLLGNSPATSTIGHVDPSMESCQMGVISGGWHGHTLSASSIHVTQLISELLNSVGVETIVIIQHVIMCWSASSLLKQTETQCYNPLSLR